MSEFAHIMLEGHDPRMSKSKRGSFQLCPYRFKKTYIDNCWGPILQSPELITGDMMHKFNDRFFKSVDVGLLSTKITRQDVLEYFYSFIDEKLPQLVKEWCANFCQFELAHLFQCRQKNELHLWKPAATELRFESDSFLGFLDRVDLLRDGSVMLVEYKPHINVQRIIGELNFYAYWYNLIKPILPHMKEFRPTYSVGCLAYADNIWWSKALSKTYERSALKDLEEMKEAKSTGVYNKKHSGFCRMCEFNRECFWDE